MNRREALSTVTLLMGGTIVGANAFLYGCKQSTRNISEALSADDIAFLDEVGETILPATASSPGAKEANVGEFMQTMISDCYSPQERDIFIKGIDKLNQASKDKFGKKFLSLEAGDKHDLLLSLEAEAKNYASTKKPEDSEIHYYTLMKQLTLLGFLTSEPGATKAMRRVSVPGRYEACIPLEDGQKAWS